MTEKQFVQLVPLDLNDPDQVGWMYKVRTHPEVISHFFAPPPSKYLDHVQFLAKAQESGERTFFIIYIEELSPLEGRDSPTAKERQVPCRNVTDSSANSALKGRDCARASVQNEMTGYCQIICRSDSLEVGFALHPLWWGKGIGGASMQALLDYIRLSEAESKTITLIVKKENTRAIHLYEKFGFITVNDHRGQLTMKRCYL